MNLAFGKKQIFSVVTRYWEINLLFALNRSGVFRYLTENGNTKQDAQAIARACGLDLAAAENALNAGAALGYLHADDDGFSISGAFDEVLTADEGGVLDWISVMERWQAPWTQLGTWLETGAPIESRDTRINSDPDYVREFILGMHEYASGNAQGCAAAVAEMIGDTSRPCRILDIGAGAGTYSFALLEALPNATSVMLDTEPVTDLSAEMATRKGLTDRVGFLNHDYRKFADALAEQTFDLILFSHVLHQETPEDVLSMLRQAREHLADGGIVLIHTYAINDNRVGPGFVNLHNISAQLLWEGGRSYSKKEFLEFLETVGLADVTTLIAEKDGRHLLAARAVAH